MNPQFTATAKFLTAGSLLRSGSRHVMLLMVLGLCSCSSARNQAANDPFEADLSQSAVNAYQESPDGETARIESAIHMESAQLAPTSNRTAIRDEQLTPVSGQSFDQYCPVPSPGGPHALLPPAGPIFTVADQETSPVKYPDEYIYDGGDSGVPVHYTQFSMQGLEPEDAVAEYRDDLGERHVEESSRVAVYSPRFAAVSVISTLGEGIAVDKAQGSLVSEYGVAVRTREKAVHQDLPIGTERVRTRLRASGLGMDAWATAVELPVVTSETSKTLNVFEDYLFVQSGQLDRSESVGISAGLQAAAVWSHEAYPVIAIETSAANEVYTKYIPQEAAGLNDPELRKGRLRIVKLADKHVATQGEIVTFTIRYDNIGDRPVNDVVVIDNLTTRMSYVPDSATSDRASKFLTEDNGAGSLIIRWKLDEPLAGGEGGVVTFKARVE